MGTAGGDGRAARDANGIEYGRRSFVRHLRGFSDKKNACATSWARLCTNTARRTRV